MSMEAWQVAFDQAREAVSAADEQFQAADHQFAGRMAENASKPVTQQDHDRWMAAKDALDKAHAAWTVIARIAPVAASSN